MSFCLLDEQKVKFVDALKEGVINPEKLSKMESEDRRELLAGIVGKENAQQVNALFESKLLLKNQKQGMITWATKVARLSPEKRNDIVTKIEKLEKALTPSEEGVFLADIVEQRLGTKVNETEAATITAFAEKMNTEWEKAENQVGENATVEQIKEVLRQDPDLGYYRTAKELSDFMAEKVPGKQIDGWFGRGLHGLSEGLAIARSVKTGLDLSAALRQGATYFGRKEWNSAFVRMFGYAKSQQAVDELEIKMMSHKYSDQALKLRRDLGLTLLGETFTQREEQFASKVTEKIPLVKGSERAYEGFLNDLRFNRFVNMLESLESVGNGITDNPEAMKNLAKVIAASTGRGTLGSAEGAAKPLATALFSPRYLASRFQLIINPLTKKGPARIEAAKALGTMAGMASTLIGMGILMGLDIEKDPRSSDWGKIKVGNTRFDLTFGMGPYLRVIAQTATLSTKSSTTGKITQLNTGDYGGRTVYDVWLDFFGNKASPIAGILRDIGKGEGFGGKEITAGYITQQLLEPIIIQSMVETYKQSGGDVLLTGTGFTAELFGIGVNSYGYVPGGKKWESLKEEKGDKEYENAVRELNESLQPRLDSIQESDAFQEFTIEEQEKVISQVIDEEKEKILKRYGIKETKTKKQPSGKQLLNKVE